MVEINNFVKSKYDILKEIMSPFFFCYFLGDSKKLDQFAKEDIKGILKQQHEGIQSLVQAKKQVLSALEVMNEKLSKVKPTGNK